MLARAERRAERRAEQSRAKQSRAEQSKAEQSGTTHQSCQRGCWHRSRRQSRTKACRRRSWRRRQSHHLALCKHFTSHRDPVGESLPAPGKDGQHACCASEQTWAAAETGTGTGTVLTGHWRVLHLVGPRAQSCECWSVVGALATERVRVPTLVAQEVSQGHLLRLLVLGRCAVCQPSSPQFEAVQSGAKNPPPLRCQPASAPGSVPMIAVCRQRAASVRALSE